MSVSATGRELSVHIRGALDQDVRRGALPLEQRGAHKCKGDNEKEQIAETRQRNHLLTDTGCRCESNDYTPTGAIGSTPGGEIHEGRHHG